MGTEPHRTRDQHVRANGRFASKLLDVALAHDVSPGTVRPKGLATTLVVLDEAQVAKTCLLLGQAPGPLPLHKFRLMLALAQNYPVMAGRNHANRHLACRLHAKPMDGVVTRLSVSANSCH